ncbi:MAG: rod shape-determining protein RodA [Candidatus Kerfeldbacteria bacterium]|nr:rod shape-determining protein RodA [Candidatus Kerfeldbacteria bacterium]
MWRKLFETFRSWDGTLFVITLLLLSIGLAELYSSSLSQPEVADLFTRQLVGLFVGLAALVAAATFDYRWYRSWSRLIYLFGVVLLVLVLIWGRTVHGTTGWFRFGTVGFQPVEVVKLLWIIVLSSYLSHVGPPLTWGKTVVASLLALPLVGLVMAQPDFGSAFLILVTLGALLVVVPKPRRWWLVAGTVTALLVLLSVSFLRGYQLERLRTFINPQADPLGSGYNVTQSVVAVGSGRWWGRGLGLGTQSQLQFLPEQHTDFIFASIAEELGLVGSGIVLGLWIWFFLRILRLIRRLRDDFAVLVAVGIFSLLAVQVVLNIGMNLGLLPVVGLTLPFMSFGSSSLVVSLAAVGVLQNLARQYSHQAPLPLTVEGRQA